MTNIDPSLIDVFPAEHDGYPDNLAQEDTRDNLMMAAGEAAREFPQSWWIEPRDWDEVTRANDADNAWALNYLDRFTNQGSGNGGYSTHECTTHSLRACFEAAWNKQRGYKVGPPVPKQRLETSAKASPVWVSCLSIYAEANPREWGGANVRQVMEIAARRGFLPDKIQPKPYGFKHDLQGTCGAGGVNQSRGDWVPLSRFPDGWQETAKHFKPLEVIFPESWEQAICCLLQGYFVGVGRNGHAVPWSKRIAGSGEVPYVDSYDRILYDSVRTQKNAWRGAFCIVTTTAPDDWDQPAT